MTHAEQLPGVLRGAERPRREQRGADAVTVLTVYLVLLLVVPSSLTLTALGSVGRPASLWALGVAVWWLVSQVQRFVPSRPGALALKIAVLAFVGVALVSYASAMLRGLPPDEVSPADSGILRLIGWAGIALVAMEGIDDIDRIRTLIRRIAIGGALMATLGLLQFLAGQSLLGWISIPGFTSDVSGLAGVDARAGYTRASGTATHPLEYALMLCAALPIAITLAIRDVGRSRFLRWLIVALIVAASILAISRSAIVGLVTGVLILVPSWSHRLRIIMGAAAAAFVLAMGILVPGVLGTLRGLFLGIGEDSSTISRVDGFQSTLEFVGRFPIVGKGLGTFLPTYDILDDEYLVLVIEVGVLGILAFLTLLACAVWSGWRARNMFTNPLDRDLSQALIASTTACAVLLAFFDAFTFPISAGITFLAVGLCGGMLRLARNRRQPKGTLRR